MRGEQRVLAGSVWQQQHASAASACRNSIMLTQRQAAWSDSGIAFFTSI
jgi:hypothetical protein